MTSLSNIYIKKKDDQYYVRLRQKIISKKFVVFLAVPAALGSAETFGLAIRASNSCSMSNPRWNNAVCVLYLCMFTAVVTDPGRYLTLPLRSRSHKIMQAKPISSNAETLCWVFREKLSYGLEYIYSCIRNFRRIEYKLSWIFRCSYCVRRYILSFGLHKTLMWADIHSPVNRYALLLQNARNFTHANINPIRVWYQMRVLTPCHLWLWNINESLYNNSSSK